VATVAEMLCLGTCYVRVLFIVNTVLRKVGQRNGIWGFEPGLAGLVVCVGGRG
jgi:hypothetical protein